MTSRARPDRPDRRILVDGRLRPAAWPVVRADDGALLGRGLFETIRVVEGRAPLWPRHRGRLAAGLAALDLPWPSAVDSSLAALPRLCRRNGMTAGEAALRLMVTAGPPAGQPLTLATLTPLSARVRARRAGAALLTRGEPRALAALKSLAWLAAYQAQSGLAEHEEALIVAADGTCLEGCSSNIFALVDGEVRTPPADGRLLAGVARGRILERCAELGQAVRETALQRADLLRADEVWITNALLPVAPVLSLDGQPLRQGGLHRTLAEGYDLNGP